VSSFAGLLFLLGGVALCVAAILLLVARERSGRSPRRSLKRFEQTRYSLHKIHKTQTTLRDAARARARAMHPAARVPTARRPGRHRRYA
jgi:hypothetical protein